MDQTVGIEREAHVKLRGCLNPILNDVSRFLLLVFRGNVFIAVKSGVDRIGERIFTR